MLAWLSVWGKVQICIWPRWCHCHSLSFASVKSRLFLPFWYWLIPVILDKGPLNTCCCCCCSKCPPTAATDNWSLLWNDMIASSVNSSGKWFHTFDKPVCSSAALVTFGISLTLSAFQHCIAYLVIHWISIWWIFCYCCIRIAILLTCLLTKMYFKVQMVVIFLNQTKCCYEICWIYGLNPPGHNYKFSCKNLLQLQI